MFDLPTALYTHSKDIKESWTILGLIVPYLDVPIVFSIVSGASNATHYADFFFSEDVHRFLKSGVTVFVDNLNYHVKGWAGGSVKYLVENLGAAYKPLPKYSPELNLIERV